MSVLPVGFGAEELQQDKIEGKAIRFRSLQAARLGRTFSLTSKTCTMSFWVKISTPKKVQYLFGWWDKATSHSSGIYMNATGQLAYMDFVGGGPGTRGNLVTKQTFLDTTAFYHVVLVLDPSKAVESDRLQFHVNGKRITDLATAKYFTLNQDHFLHTTRQWFIGCAAADLFFDGLMSDYHLVDGLDVPPTEFGTFDRDGVWVPKKYAGAHGPSGFYLPFSGTDFGKDKSGNNNDFSAFAISSSIDFLADSPNENMMSLVSSKAGSPTISLEDSNLTMAGGNSHALASANFHQSGRWYFEVTFAALAGVVGVGVSRRSPDDLMRILYQSDGKKVTSAGVGAYGATYTQASVIGVAVDCLSSVVEFFKDGVSQGKIPFSESSISPTDVTAILVTSGVGARMNVNFGQWAFRFPAPATFRSFTTAHSPGGNSISTAGTFTGNANADGPYVWLGGNPETMTINGNAVVWGTHAIKHAGGFKVISAAATHNLAGVNHFAVTSTGKLYGDAGHAPNVAQLS